MANQPVFPSSLPPPWRYHVFLSFRGEDTRTNFTDHLYRALVDKEIKTFIDRDLQRGEEISLSLLKAIEESRISLVILSKHYADSRWCLEELVKIHQCRESKGQIILPVFYKVDPSHVRNQKGCYGAAFRDHERKFEDKEMVLRWRRALTKVANLSGYHVKEEDYEGTKINDIVKDILVRVLDGTYLEGSHPYKASEPEHGSGCGRKPEYEAPKSEYGSGYGRKPEYEAPESEYGSWYGRKPEYEASESEYGSGYGRKPEYKAPEFEYGSGYGESEYGSGYGESEYGSGYGRKPEFEAPPAEFGSGYGRKPPRKPSYGEKGSYGEKPPRRPTYGRPSYEMPESEERPSYGTTEFERPGYGEEPPRKTGYGDEPPPPRPSYGRPSYEGQESGEYEKPSYGRSEEQEYGDEGYDRKKYGRVFGH